MNDTTTDRTADMLEITGMIVASYVSNNTIPTDALPVLIKTVYDSLANVAGPVAPETAKLQPAVPIKRSVFPDYIVCLEDGKKLKMLKRHLMSAYGMTGEAYREKWGLPPDYPMVAPAYAERRSVLAKEIGLGRKIAAAPPAKPDPVPVEEAKPATLRRGRKPKIQQAALI